jgi:predicted deacetylase
LPPFLVCIHDATPAYAQETRALIPALAPLVGRRLSLGVVPNWNGAWPLAAHPDFCGLLQESSEELLLHGYFHRRQRGWGPTSLLTQRSDEMNGLDSDETQRTIERGQHVFVDVFGAPARGFLAPAWQVGHVRRTSETALGLEHLMGFFSLESRTGRRIPLSTFTWDCSRWSWTGHVGHAIGSMLHAIDRGVPTLAIHPRDLDRGFWPKILRLTETLLATGHEPSTMTGLLEARC